MTPATIEAINWLTPNIAQLWLAPQENYTWQAGNYLTLTPHADLKPRPFSIANAPNAASRIELHIQNTNDDWFKGLFSKQADDSVLLGAPQLQYPQPRGDQPVIFVAGGTGFAPFKALTEQLLQQNFNQKVFFYWGARTEQALYQHDVIQSWAQHNPTLHYIPVLSEEMWAGRTGLVADAVLADFEDLSGYEIYVCGPWPMVQDAKDRFSERGAEHIY